MSTTTVTGTLGADLPIRDPSQRPNNGRRVIAYNTATAQELLRNAARCVAAGEATSVWHILTAELDAAMAQRQPGQSNEVRWAMLQLVREELHGQQLPMPGMCPSCGK